MIGTSTIEYVFIRACILVLSHIAPLCFAYCICATFLTQRQRLPLSLEVWAAAEVLFCILIQGWYQEYLQRPAVHPPSTSSAERKRAFYRCNANVTDPERYLRGWFFNSPIGDIKRENLKDFILWAFFNRLGPPGEDDAELEEYVAATENLLGRDIEPGRGPAKCLRLTFDDVHMQHRSLLWYFCVFFVDFLTTLNLMRHGFLFHRTALSRFFLLFPPRLITLVTRRRSPAKHISYWLRPHTAKDKLPVLFIHGIGIGLYPYVNFLADINAASSNDPNDQIGIIAIEIMPISFRITHPALEREEMCRQIKQILDHHGFDNFVLVAHSYGTAVATHLLHSHLFEQPIGPIVLIDPITILLHHPDVAFNFTRREPVRANEHQLYYFASMDMGVSHTLSRLFFWADNILWKEDIVDHQVLVSLAEKDLIVNTEAVRRYLTARDGDDNSESDTLRLQNGHCGNTVQTKQYMKEYKGTNNLNVMWYEDLDHAQVFDRTETRKPLVEGIRVYCKQYGMKGGNS